jgi:hypothetical protein
MEMSPPTTFGRKGAKAVFHVDDADAEGAHSGFLFGGTDEIPPIFCLPRIREIRQFHDHPPIPFRNPPEGPNRSGRRGSQNRSDREYRGDLDPAGVNAALDPHLIYDPLKAEFGEVLNDPLGHVVGRIGDPDYGNAAGVKDFAHRDSLRQKIA